MKSYPSIPSALKSDFGWQAHIFDKLDGSNLRFEWSKKQGWYKYGSRTQLISAETPILGESIALFHETWASELEAINKFKKWENAIYFLEFHGEHSIAGSHNPTDIKKLTLFDCAPYKEGILGPERFLDLFGHLSIAKYLGEYTWDKDFIEAIWRNEIDGVTFEGVVGKNGDKHKLVMAKAKTKKWIDAIKARYSAQDAERIINS